MNSTYINYIRHLKYNKTIFSFFGHGKLAESGVTLNGGKNILFVGNQAGKAFKLCNPAKNVFFETKADQLRM